MLVVFDLETKKLSTDLAPDGFPISWEAERLGFMGISWGVAYCKGKKIDEYRHFQDNDLAELINLLEMADTVVSFNGKKFDVPLLEACSGLKIHIKEHYDILDEFYKATGHRIHLDTLAEKNLGMRKILHDGKDVIRLFNEGKFAALATYCQKDAELTYRLYDQIDYNKFYEGKRYLFGHSNEEVILK